LATEALCRKRRLAPWAMRWRRGADAVANAERGGLSLNAARPSREQWNEARRAAEALQEKHGYDAMAICRLVLKQAPDGETARHLKMILSILRSSRVREADLAERQIPTSKRPRPGLILSPWRARIGQHIWRLFRRFKKTAASQRSDLNHHRSMDR
jgi:hypothetical protein